MRVLGTLSGAFFGSLTTILHKNIHENYENIRVSIGYILNRAYTVQANAQSKRQEQTDGERRTDILMDGRINVSPTPMSVR